MFVFYTIPQLTEIYTLSLHDALPISGASATRRGSISCNCARSQTRSPTPSAIRRRRRGFGSCSRRKWRSEEHTSELQSRFDLVCRLLLEKKKVNTLPPRSETTYFFLS